MSEPRVIRADYSNWRPVAGRKVLQLILEVPIEQTADVMEKLGFPLPGESKWVAVALLENGKPASESEGGILNQTPKPSGGTDAREIRIGSVPSPTSAITAKAGTSEIHNKERKPFASLPLSQQAAIRCSDPEFRKFLARNSQAFLMFDTDMAADEVRSFCGVGSRRELDIEENTASRRLWAELDGEYQAWRTDIHYADARR